MTQPRRLLLSFHHRAWRPCDSSPRCPPHLLLLPPLLLRLRHSLCINMSSNRHLERTSSDSSFASLSSASTSSTASEDWDASFTLPSKQVTPRNSVIFPNDVHSTPQRPESEPATANVQGHTRSGSGKRTLSDLLKLHAEKGTNCAFTQEEAKRVGDVLGQWVGGNRPGCDGY